MAHNPLHVFPHLHALPVDPAGPRAWTPESSLMVDTAKVSEAEGSGPVPKVGDAPPSLDVAKRSR